MHFERLNAFQNAKNNIFFPEKKICVPTLKIFRPVTQNTFFFYLALLKWVPRSRIVNKSDYISRGSEFDPGQD